MTLEFVDNYLNAKLAQNREIIKFSFYEVRMKLNLSEEDSITFLSLISQKLMNTEIGRASCRERVYVLV